MAAPACQYAQTSARPAGFAVEGDFLVEIGAHAIRRKDPTLFRQSGNAAMKATVGHFGGPP